MNNLRLVYPLFFLALGAFFYMSSPSGPPDAAFLDDRAGLLNSRQAAKVVQKSRFILAEKNIHLFVLTVSPSSAESLAQRSAVWMEEKKVGLHTEGRGLLLMVAPAKEQVRLKVSSNLQPLFNKDFIAFVEKPLPDRTFQSKSPGDAIEHLVSLIVEQAEGKMSVSDYLADGAPNATQKINPAHYQAGKAPVASLQTYLKLLEEGITAPNLPLYTERSRRFLRNNPPTETERKQELNNLKRKLPSVLVNMDGDYAVVRFPVKESHYSPYFFNQTAAGWELDLFTRNRVVKYDDAGSWFFATLDHPYAFAYPKERIGVDGYLK